MNALFEKIWVNKFVFLGTFFVVFTISYVVLVALDFLPEPIAGENPAAEKDDSSKALNGVTEAAAEVAEVGEVTKLQETGEVLTVIVAEPAAATSVAVMPKEVRIARLDKTVKVLNPDSRTIADLDAALLEGVVRHPDSATLSQNGNMFILGHSSYLPNVLNRNFQAFNGIQNLEWGDKIQVYSDSDIYEYRVEKVYRARAQDVTVPIAGTGKMLTLATCNSFGSVDDRYIVEAKQIKVEPI
jgi:LPXTG-site transpeptidase (sortase) family protein